MESDDENKFAHTNNYLKAKKLSKRRRVEGGSNMSGPSIRKLDQVQPPPESGGKFSGAPSMSADDESSFDVSEENPE